MLVLEEARLLRKILPFCNSADQDQLDQAASCLNGSLGLMREAEAYEHQNHYIDGLRLLLSQPEFSGGEPARHLVQLFEEKRLLGRLLNGTTENEVVFVFIGSENRVEFMNPFGIILYQYGVPQRVNGTIGVTGPRRMGYGTAVGGVRYLSALMGQMVYGINGKSV